MFDNPITTIDDAAFNGLSSTLETLYFMDARFTRIPDAFLHLDVLQHLNIYNTHIEDWNIGAMAHIGQTMHTLNLGNVGFTSWPTWIQYFSSLEELNMPDGSIASIPDNALDNLDNKLSFLTISNNSLISVSKTLSKLSNLMTLDLHDNKLINLTWLPVSDSLDALWLQDNKIFDPVLLSEAINSSTHSLTSLYLSNNKLTAIPSLSFLKMLETLDLSHNIISNPSSGPLSATVDQLDLSYNLFPSVPTVFKSLTSLMFLSLSHNAIQELRETDIPVWVTDVNLGYNLITELTDSSFPRDSALANLNLNNNPISVISNFAFKEMQSLRSLNLQETKLSRIPLSLMYLTGLYSLNLNNCPYLVCTCVEKDVGQKITSSTDILGTCGEMSIKDFFSTLSQDCP